jgi:sulfatase modifying factor 1
MPWQSQWSAAGVRRERWLVVSLSAFLVTCAGNDAAYAPSDPPRPGVRLAIEGEIAPRVEQSTVEDAVASAVIDADEGACPEGMILVEGSFCPNVAQTCKKWLDPKGRYHEFRCAEYAQPSTCKSKQKQKMRFCIDRDEQKLATAADDPRPTNQVSWLAAKAQCESKGARLCSEHEWTFACEGEEMRPYPYGFARDATACNIDRDDLGGGVGRLHDQRTAVGANPKCASPFGVLDMAGNLEEWTTASTKHEHATLLKGSWWLPGRSTCRAANGGHDAYYHGTETGFRCCK